MVKGKHEKLGERVKGIFFFLPPSSWGCENRNGVY